MELIFVFLTFVVTVLLVVTVGSLFMNRRAQVQDRLGKIQSMSADAPPEDVLRLPFMQRIVVPGLSGLGHFFGKVAPWEIRRRVDNRITYAGKPWNLNFFSLLAVQILLGAGGLFFSLFMLRLFQGEVGLMVLIVLLVTLVAFFLPYGVISSKAESRQIAVRKSLPDVLDLLLVSVEAGLGFDMAMKRVTQQMVGPLSEEIKRALDEIRMGGTREVALRSIATRSGVKDLSSFISSVVQAEELGSDIAGTLRVQSDYMRQRRRQRAQEMANKAPVKLIFPLLFFIFPALFIVILGPAAINIFRMLMNL